MPTFRLLPDLEEAIRHLPGVRAASVVTNAEKVPVEVHVLAAPGKPARHVVRDVQSLAMARYDIDLDHRIVSVVLLADEDVPELAAHRAAGPAGNAAPAGNGSAAHEPARSGQAAPVDPDLVAAAADLAATAREEAIAEPAPAPAVPSVEVAGSAPAGSAGTGDRVEQWGSVPEVRPVISSIMVRTAGAEAEATVALGAEGKVYEGRVIGSGAPTHRPRLVAEATLAALRDLLDTRAEVEDAFLHDTGSRLVALTVLSITVPRVGPQAVSGSAVVRTDEADAVARSVLDAVNRRLSSS
jgi:hypothetical protein